MLYTWHSVDGEEDGRPSLWADVWVTWKERPNRKKTIGPCLDCLRCVQYEANKYREQAESPTMLHLKSLEDFDLEKVPNTEENRAEMRKEMEAENALAARIEAEGLVTRYQEDDGGFTIYTSKPHLSTPECERMIAWYLQQSGRIKSPEMARFKWQPPKPFNAPPRRRNRVKVRPKHRRV